jgi:ERCC4-type nuclease
VRLASTLTKFELDIMDVGELAAEVVEKKKVEKIEELEGITPEIVSKLATANMISPEQLKGLGMKDLMTVEGITEEEAHMIVEAMKKVA